MHAFFFFFLLQEILDDCISNCNCDNNDYNPICLEEIGLNFYSACAAGCSEFRIDEATNVLSYGGCQCLHQHTNDSLYYGHPSKEVRSILLAYAWCKWSPLSVPFPPVTSISISKGNIILLNEIAMFLDLVADLCLLLSTL